jgi:hypothetical protein
MSSGKAASSEARQVSPRHNGTGSRTSTVLFRTPGWNSLDGVEASIGGRGATIADGCGLFADCLEDGYRLVADWLRIGCGITYLPLSFFRIILFIALTANRILSRVSSTWPPEVT